MYKDSDFVKLGLRVKPGPKYIWLSCLKSTADFYGWSEAFPTLFDLKMATTGGPVIQDPGRKGWKSGGGKEVRICRSPSTVGWPAGMTNAFRVSSDAALADLAAIAEATTVDWHWMTCFHGGRRPKQWWLDSSFSVGAPGRREQAAG